MRTDTAAPLAEAAARRHELTRAKARLTAPLLRNQRLADENARLRRQLGHALGAARRPR